MARKKLVDYNMANITEAAETLFFKKGVEKTTMDEIAAEAECSKSTMYVYFKSKDDIFNHLVGKYMEELYNLISSEIDRADKDNRGDYDTFLAICNIIADFYHKYPLFFDSITGGINADEKTLNNDLAMMKIAIVTEKMNDLVAGFLRRGIEAGNIDPKLDITVAVYTLWTSVSGVILTANRKEEYFKTKLKMSKSEYMNKAFGMLYSSVMRK